MQFDGKVALVTGGATGIGQAAALAFARAGAAVVIGDTDARAAGTVEDIRAAGGRAADPSEMSGMILHLCSDAASFTTGQVFVIDGGQTAV